VIAHFMPQVWVNDYAQEIKGDYNFDVTDLINEMGRDKALALEDGQLSTDELWRDWVADHPEQDHDGPFIVTVEHAIKEHFAALDKN
jgi:hypothetical protein